MHAAAQWTAFAGIHSGGTIVLHDDSAPFDARTILETIARERVNLMSIVGDAFARRLIEELRRTTYDLASLQTIATGGAVTSEACKQALLELLPHITIVDGYGASETGGHGLSARRPRGRSRAASRPRRAPRSSRRTGAASSRRATTRSAGPRGAGACRSATSATGRRPRRPSRSSTASASPSPAIARGSRRTARSSLLGRDSLVVNSGGEKIFVEEVEEVLRRHPDVVDALVVGRPSERFGEEVVGIVQLRPGATLDPHELREFTAQAIARFKAPRAIAFCDRVRRHPSGKADYTWARSVAGEAVDATARAGS